MDDAYKRRVVVSGLGCVAPVGNSVRDTWSAIVCGKSGIGPITRFDTADFATRFAGEVKGFDIDAYLPGKEARHMDRFTQYGMAAAMQAIKDSAIAVTALNEDRIGVLIGAGTGGLPFIENSHAELMRRGARRINPFFIPSAIINLVSGNISMMFGMKGPNLSIATACATGVHAIGFAARLIEYGDADVMLAGSTESCISPLGIGGFNAALALSTRNDDPATASRPWDRDRDGFVMGEGAGVMVLEEYEHAKKRGAPIYAECRGFGMSADAHHVAAPSKDGAGAMRSMQMALKNGGVNPDEVNYLNAHATSTKSGDRAETIAIKNTFGAHARHIVVNSTKSMTGHLLGGAGGLEAVLTVLALQHQISPPTINLFNQDPDCDLDYCANTARDLAIDVAVKNSFGFGGTNGTLVFGRI